MGMPSALEISRRATLKPVGEIAAEIGLPPWLIEPYGEHVAKIDLGAIEALADRPRARYVVVTAVTPTPLGEARTARADHEPGAEGCGGWRRWARPGGVQLPAGSPALPVRRRKEVSVTQDCVRRHCR